MHDTRGLFGGFGVDRDGGDRRQQLRARIGTAAGREADVSETNQLLVLAMRFAEISLFAIGGGTSTIVPMMTGLSPISGR